MKPMVAEVTVSSVRDLSPSFRRIELAAPALADFGVDGPFYDQRIKIVVPTAGGRLASCEGWGAGWWDAWRSLPEEERGHMRTYSVREVTGEGKDTRLLVDFVLHQAPGSTGPAADWAAGAAVGDRVLVVGPRRGGSPGGIEFDPGAATDILLVADETAVPAVSRILGDLLDLAPEATGTALLEVPHAGDALDLDAPENFDVRWLPRNGRPHGQRLIEAVTAHLGATAAPDAPVEVDPDIWDTPARAGAVGPASTRLPDLYAWIAGESGVVTRLRRHVVTDLGVDRRQVAFMGYWRHGSPMA